VVLLVVWLVVLLVVLALSALRLQCPALLMSASCWEGH
jgi:hypothetical protein